MIQAVWHKGAVQDHDLSANFKRRVRVKPIKLGNGGSVLADCRDYAGFHVIEGI
jgi:hypothetical protein